MVARRSSYGRQGTRPGRRNRRRRRASVSTRARYQRPSARNQQRQIQSLAKLALANRKALAASRSYTDWYASATVLGTSSLWNATSLMEMADWAAGNRQDADVLVSQNIWLRNMVFEYFFQTYNKTEPISVDMYIVTIRPSASDWEPSAAPTGSLRPDDYQDMGFTNSASLNSGVFKVLWNKQFRIFPQDPALVDKAGNPFATYRQGQVNLSLNFKLRSPLSTSWKSLRASDIPARQRVYLLWRATSADTSNQYRFTWGQHVTAIAQS